MCKQQHRIKNLQGLPGFFSGYVYPSVVWHYICNYTWLIDEEVVGFGKWICSATFPCCDYYYCGCCCYCRSQIEHVPQKSHPLLHSGINCILKWYTGHTEKEDISYGVALTGVCSIKNKLLLSSRHTNNTVYSHSFINSDWPRIWYKILQRTRKTNLNNPLGIALNGIAAADALFAIQLDGVCKNPAASWKWWQKWKSH